MTTGKSAYRPSWRLTASWNSKAPTVCSTNSCPTSTSMKSTANSAPLRQPHVTKPAPKTAQSSVPSPTARGGPLSGVNAAVSASAMTAKCPSAPSASRLMRHPVPGSFVACARMVTSTTSAMPQTPAPNPSSCSIVPSSDLSAFDRTLFSSFECYTTFPLFPLAFRLELPIFRAAWAPCVRTSIEAEKEKLTENLTFNLRCHRNDWSVRQWSFGKPRADQVSRRFVRSKLVIIC